MTTQPGTKNRIGQTRTIALSGTAQATRPPPSDGEHDTRRWRRRSAARCRRRPRGVPQRVDDSDVTARTILHVDLDAFFAAVEQRDRPELRGRPVVVGGPGGEYAAASSRPPATRRAGSASTPRCRCARRTGAARTPSSCRSTAVATRPPAARSWRSSGATRRLVEPISIDEAFLDVTGSASAVRRRPDHRPADQGRRPGRGRADRLGRGREHQARGQDRVGPAQARRAGRRAARRGGGLPRAAADRAAVGRRGQDRGGAARLLGPDDRRPRGACRPISSSAGSASTARRSSTARAASIPIRSTRAIRPSRSATSTPSTSTRAIRRSSSGRCSAWPTASPGASARRASGRGPSR